MAGWIQNVSMFNILEGFHIDPGENSMLIQIVDPDVEFPIPKYKFREVHQFKFLDVERNDFVIEESMRCSQDQATQLVSLLKHAIDNHMTVLVHCHAGVCRSGAVCEVGIMMGLRDTETFRSPNLLVKHLMMKALGWTYDDQEPHSTNGIPLPEDWTNDNEKVFLLAAARRKHREQNGDI